MHHRSPVRTASSSRRAAGLFLAAAGVAVLAGCGSSASNGAEPKPTELCRAVEQYGTAVEAGDRTDMANILAASIDGLPEEGQRAVHAYVLALRGAPSDHSPDADGVTSSSTQESFDTYVTDTCGEEALAAPVTTTSTTMVATSTTISAGDQGTGTDGSTGDQGTDSKSDPGTGSGSGSGSSSGSGSGSGSDSDMGSGGAGTGNGSGTDNGGSSQSGGATG